VKQLINNICQLKLQSCLFGVTCLFINYNINAIRNGLENHTGRHTRRVYVTTGAGMSEQAFKGDYRMIGWQSAINH